MITKIGHVGQAPERLSYRGFRVERKGFLTTISYLLEGVSRRYDLIERGQIVAVLPVDPQTRELYLLSEIRPHRPFGRLGSGRDWIKKVLRDAFTGPDEVYEIPVDDARLHETCAGLIDGDETPEAAAVRELREETGLVVEEDWLIPVGPHMLSSGSSTEVVHLFIALLGKDHAATRLQPEGDGGSEMLAVLRMSWDDAYGLLAAGRIETASTGLLLRELKIMDLEGGF